MPATPSSPSSTTRRSSAPPTTSSRSAPVPDERAAASSIWTAPQSVTRAVLERTRSGTSPRPPPRADRVDAASRERGRTTCVGSTSASRSACRSACAGCPGRGSPRSSSTPSRWALARPKTNIPGRGRGPRPARRTRRHLRCSRSHGRRRPVPGRDHLAGHVPRAHRRRPQGVRRERSGQRAGHHDQGPHLRLRRLQRQRGVAGGHVVPAVGDPDLRRLRRIRLSPRGRQPSPSGAERLADIEALTIAELVDEWGDIDAVRRVGGAAIALGLGYLIVRQPGWSLSGGEAQRLKLAKELARPTKADRPLRAGRAHRRPPGDRRRSARPRARRDRRRRQQRARRRARSGPARRPATGSSSSARARARTAAEIVFEGPPDGLAKADTSTAPYFVEVLAMRSARCCSETRPRRCGGAPRVELDGADRRGRRGQGVARRDRRQPRTSGTRRAAGRGRRPQAAGYLLCQLAYLGYRGPRLAAAVEAIFDSQQPDGSWPVGRRRLSAASRRGARLSPDRRPPLHHHADRQSRCAASPPRASPPILAPNEPTNGSSVPRLQDGSWPAGPKADLGRPGAPVPPEKEYRRLHPRCRVADRRRPAPWPAWRCTPSDGDPTPPGSASTTSSPARPGTRRPSAGRCPVWSGSNAAMGQVTFYVTFDLAFLLDLASRCGVSSQDRRVRDLVDYLETLRGPYGLWQHPAHPQLSGWLTFDLECSLADSPTATGSATRNPPPSLPTCAALADTDPMSKGRGVKP